MSVAALARTAAGSLALAAADLPDEPVEIGSGPQFLVDDWIVDNRWALREAKEAVVRVVHQPSKHEGNPVLPGRGGYASVVWDAEAKLYRLVYQDFWLQSPKPDLKYTYGIAYAESRDGLEWTVPNLGLHEWRNTEQNNIVWLGPTRARAAAPFLLDLPPEHRRGHRFVMLYKAGDGMHLIGSRDCIHWEPASDVCIARRFWPDTQNCIVWDSGREEFVWFARATNRYHDSKDVRAGGATRRVARLANKELWTEWPVTPQNLLIPDAEDAAAGFTFFYGMPTRHYGGLYWGFLWPFKLNTDIYTELVISRTGRRFARLPRRPRLLDLGPDGSWDDGMIFGSPGWVEVGDSWRIYYCGYDGPHGSFDRTPGIGMATIRKEGFVSLRGPKGGGVVCTRLLVWPGGRLRVNCQARKGELRVRVSDTGRAPMPGLDYDDCKPFSGDATDHRVTWRGRDMGALAGKVIRLEFLLTNADLYAFQAVPK